MAKRDELREQLFNAHAADLSDFDSSRTDNFVCPICLRIFSREHLVPEILSVGHIWPKRIRDVDSNVAPYQRVLLCRECNSSAGSHGDAHMQSYEELREEGNSDKSSERQLIRIIRPPGNDITLRGHILANEVEQTGQLTFSNRVNDPNQVDKFLQLINSGEAFSITAQRECLPKTSLAQAGWITSSYLYAFYTFGYRYILHDSLTSVRKYIRDSFTCSQDEYPQLKRTIDFGIFISDTHYYKEPQIGLRIPLDGQTLYLLISFLDRIVRLPFHFVPKVLRILVENHIPDVNGLGDADILYAKITCTKTEKHVCVWDHVLGKPIPGTTED